jgi:hypothetical protein
MRNGFEIIATIEGHPRGYRNVLMRKQLAGLSSGGGRRSPRAGETGL